MHGEPATTKHILELIFNGFLIVFVVFFGGWGFIRVLKKSEDPPLLIFKWILTGVIVTFMAMVLGPMMRKGGFDAAFVGVPTTAVCGLILAAIWRKNIANMIATPIGNIYDGGTAEYEARPVYSHAISLRKRGHYQEALAAVRKELEKFPTDIEGQLLIADIQAENLHDLPAATIGIERICNQPEHTLRNMAMALNQLADWHLKFHQDRDGAREVLQRVIDQFPDSEMSVLAAQRIASLASGEHLQTAHDRKRFTVAEGVKDIGLIDPKSYQAPADPDAAKQAAELVAHLHAYPLDAEAREKLAIIYADHYHRLDLATDQMEQLITHPNQPQKRVVQWLNKLADLQIRHGANYDTVRATLQRIVDLFPDAAGADVAAHRIALLKLELKGKEKVADVKLGTYEQDIGLKMK
jgi:tetratricopeptide (TPR) repeat protein